MGFAIGFAVATALWRFGPLAVPPIVTAPAAEAAVPGLPPARMIAVSGRPTRGPADAPITIVEFTDYECGYCRRHFEHTYPLIQAAYGDRIRYVIKNFPLTSIHPNALRAAEAAECAFDQDRFWEYHDRLFRANGNLRVEDLKSYARELGMDGERFDQCLDSESKRGIVESDFREAVALGLRGTPAFFINGRSVYGAQPMEVFEAYFQALDP
jgi:protein-disulfide isomerase